MAFAHPLWLILLLAPLAWLLYDWPRTTGKPRLVLKALAIALIIGALSEPRLDFEKTKTEFRRHAPRIGEDGPEVLREAGLSDAEIEKLKADKTLIVPS